MTIKIISSRGPAEANLQAVEREEQILNVARSLSAAMGTTDPENVERCASKIRSASAFGGPSTLDRIVAEISMGITSNRSASAILRSLDFDIDRIMSLLEG